ncbi:MAG TPA: AAA family ATPase [Terriglobales bacterium]|nr:AAA family ATPase [Terriglobales bacterium]
MLLDHFHFREQPFGVTPDPRFFYPSGTHREALASMLYGVQSERGFMAMIAQPGMGKTMLLFNLLQQLGSSARTAFLFQTQCDAREFLGYLLTDLGIKIRDYNPIRMHEELKAELLKEAQAGRQVVVIIDEAQNLDTSVLETIRLLSDFENPGRKLLQIILAGQSQLAEKIASPQLMQLRQRLSLIIPIKPLSRTEVATYMARRMQVAGYDGPALFTPEAVGMIAARSRGIPRVVNNYCFNALSIACAAQKPVVDREIVLEVAHDLELMDFFTPGPQADNDQELVPTELPVFPPDPARSAPLATASPTAIFHHESEPAFAANTVAQSSAATERPAQQDAPRAFLAEMWHENFARAYSSFCQAGSHVLVRSAAGIRGAKLVCKRGSAFAVRVTSNMASRAARGSVAVARSFAAAANQGWRASSKLAAEKIVPALHRAGSHTSRFVSRLWKLLLQCIFAFVLAFLRISEVMVRSLLSTIRSFESKLPAEAPLARLPEQDKALTECKAEGANV